jgi:hypothetical protein
VCSKFMVVCLSRTLKIPYLPLARLVVVRLANLKYKFTYEYFHLILKSMGKPKTKRIKSAIKNHLSSGTEPKTRQERPFRSKWQLTAIVILLVFAIVMLGLWWNRVDPADGVRTYDQCINEGGRTIDSQPLKCISKAGYEFTKPQPLRVCGPRTGCH